MRNIKKIICLNLKENFFGEMNIVNIQNIVIEDNPSSFLSPFKFKVTMDCPKRLKNGKKKALI